MDISTMDQGLLTRNPSLTPEEFSAHWYNVHAPLVAPMFLFLGVQHYEQIHGPFTMPKSENGVVLDTTSFDGVVALPPAPLSGTLPKGTPEWVQAYYDEVVKVDEKRFLVSEALDHIVRVQPGSVMGARKVVIEGGELRVNVSEEVWAVWKDFETRGVREGGVR